MIIKRKLFSKRRTITHSVRGKKVLIDTIIDRNDVAESRLNNPVFEDIGKEAYENFGDDHVSASNWIYEELEKRGTHPDALASEMEKSIRHYNNQRKGNKDKNK